MDALMCNLTASSDRETSLVMCRIGSEPIQIDDRNASKQDHILSWGNLIGPFWKHLWKYRGNFRKQETMRIGMRASLHGLQVVLFLHQFPRVRLLHISLPLRPHRFTNAPIQ